MILQHSSGLPDLEGKRSGQTRTVLDSGLERHHLCTGVCVQESFLHTLIACDSAPSPFLIVHHAWKATLKIKVCWTTECIPATSDIRLYFWSFLLLPEARHAESSHTHSVAVFNGTSFLLLSRHSLHLLSRPPLLVLSRPSIRQPSLPKRTISTTFHRTRQLFSSTSQRAELSGR